MRYGPDIFQLLLLLVLVSCVKEESTGLPEHVQVETGRINGRILTVRIELNPMMYRNSRYGEPPQMAVWLENPDTGDIQTLWVTRRTGTGRWVGKVECLTSLPYWNSRFLLESGYQPEYLNPVPDGITGATPRNSVEIKTEFTGESNQYLYVEINAAGDFNDTYPSVDAQGVPDSEGNGQPSLVYRTYLGKSVDVHPPELRGATLQHRQSSGLDLHPVGLTTALQLIESITISTTP